jgi:hypothetical protein
LLPSTQLESVSTSLVDRSQQAQRNDSRSKRNLTQMYVLCLFYSKHRSRKADQIMIRTGSDRKLAETSEVEEKAGAMKRLLAKAKQQIIRLQEKVADQKQQIRELQVQAKHEDGLAVEREELKGEIVDLKGEIKELTRVNREYAAKLDTFREENAMLKARVKVQSPSRVDVQASLRGSPQPLLS